MRYQSEHVLSLNLFTNKNKYRLLLCFKKVLILFLFTLILRYHYVNNGINSLTFKKNPVNNLAKNQPNSYNMLTFDNKFHFENDGDICF